MKNLNILAYRPSTNEATIARETPLSLITVKVTESSLRRLWHLVWQLETIEVKRHPNGDITFMRKENNK